MKHQWTTTHFLKRTSYTYFSTIFYASPKPDFKNGLSRNDAVGISPDQEKILYGKGLFYIGGNRGRGQARAWVFLGFPLGFTWVFLGMYWFGGVFLWVWSHFSKQLQSSMCEMACVGDVTAGVRLLFWRDFDIGHKVSLGLFPFFQSWEDMRSLPDGFLRADMW